MIKRKKTEVDLAVEILMEKMEPMFFKELIHEIAARMGRQQDIPTLTSIYSRLNVDNRMVYEGDGYWYYDMDRVNRKANLR